MAEVVRSITKVEQRLDNGVRIWTGGAAGGDELRVQTAPFWRLSFGTVVRLPVWEVLQTSWQVRRRWGIAVVGWVLVTAGLISLSGSLPAAVAVLGVVAGAGLVIIGHTGSLVLVAQSTDQAAWFYPLGRPTQQRRAALRVAVRDLNIYLKEHHHRPVRPTLVRPRGRGGRGGPEAA